MSFPNELPRRVLQDYDSGSRRALGLFGVGEVSKEDTEEWRTETLLSSIEKLDADFNARQYQGYAYDTLELRLGVDEGNDLCQSRNNLAEQLKLPNYFDGYCLTRAISPASLVTRCVELLEETAEDYYQGLTTFFGSTPTQDQFTDAYKAILTGSTELYSLDHIQRSIEKTVDYYGLDSKIEIFRGSASGITTNVTTLRPRKATLFLAETNGLESYRAACHGLGHAMFAVDQHNDVVDVMGVNIGATEVSAFAAQEIALEQASEQDRVLLDIMPTYYARLYALRTVSESHFYEGDSERALKWRDYSTSLGLLDVPLFSPAKQLKSVDFVLAFSEYLRLDSTHSWESVFNMNYSNRGILESHNCLDGSIKNSSRIAV